MVKTKKVPTGWELTPLSKVLVERTERKGKTDVEIYSVAVNKGVVNQVEHLGRSYAAEDTSNYNLVSFGDIVYTKSPTGDFPYGIVKQSHVKQDVAVSPLYGVYKPRNFYLGLFLDYYFQSHINANNYLKKIVNKGAKNTILVSNQGFLHNRILLPNDPLEQQKIVEILMTQDKVIALKEQLLEEKKKQKKWLMQNLLTGRIRLSGFTESWGIKKLKECGEFLQGLTYSPDDIQKEGILVLRSTNIQDDSISLDDCVYVNCQVPKSKLVKTNDILICVRNGSRSLVGKCVLIDKKLKAAFGAFMAVFRCDNFYYFLHVLKSDMFRRQILVSSGTTISQITKKEFDKIKIRIPSPLEQSAIAERLFSADKEIELLTKDLESQKNLKKYLMQQLLTGKIRV